MITPSHLIYSWAVAKYSAPAEVPTHPYRTAAFVAGALIPDLAVYVFFIVNGLILGYGHELMWDDMYFNSAWSVAFTLSHSLLLWPCILAIATLAKQKLLQYVAISAILHVCVDFLVHTDDAYKHFWPLTDWRFISPVSYWNRAEYGIYVGVFDSLLVLGLLTYLYTHYQGRVWHIVIGGIGALYAVRLVAELYF